MPFTQIHIRKGRTREQKQAIMDGLYTAMRETLAVPEDDRFMTITEYDPENFSFSYNYPNVNRTDDLILIQLTISNTRSRAQKLDFYRAVNRELTERLGCSPNDIFINVVGVLPENWSFGQGRAQNIE